MSGPVTVARWFGDADRPLLGWVTTPAGRPTSSGVLVVAPIGYEWWSTHATLRRLAEQLAGRGLTVLRYDPDGTGDSAGQPTDPGRLDAWRAGIGVAAGELRRLGVTDIAIVGMDSGGLLALLEAPAIDPAAVVAWAPPPSGRHWARRLRLLAQPVPPDAAPGAPAITVSGVVFPEADLAAISALRIGSEPSRGHRTLLVARADGALDRLAIDLRAAGSGTDVIVDTATGELLDGPAEDAVPPEAGIRAVCDWVSAALPAGEPAGVMDVARPAADFASAAGAVIEESVVAVGQHGLVGVQTRPAGDDRARAPMLVLLNSGSEPHIGPGRTWVDLARALAARGHRTLRLDMRGWGESPSEGRPPSRPYDAHGVADAIEAVAALRSQGPIAVGGLCAGAWTAMEAATAEPPAAILAINPQLYYRVGDPVEALLSETRRRRAPERRREELGARWRLWSALDVLGARPAAARRLARLRRSGVRVELVFAAGDDGIEWLNNRMARRLQRELACGAHRLREVPGIDHQMYSYWLRLGIIDAADELLRDIGSTQASARSTSSQIV